MPIGSDCPKNDHVALLYQVLFQVDGGHEFAVR